MKLTGETITDEQLRDIRDEFAGTGIGDTYHHAMIALGVRRADRGHTRAESREHCAEILNARNGAKS